MSAVSEQWRPIPKVGPKFEVSDQGNIRVAISDTIYKRVNQFTTPKGYKIISHNYHQHLVHRLVAEAFIPNPEKFRMVAHKNGDKSNNCVYNLEWQSSKINQKKSYIKGTSGRERLYCEELDKVFISLHTAAVYTSVPQELLSKAIQKNSSICGLTFRKVAADDKLLQNHKVLYIEASEDLELALNSKSYKEYHDKVVAKIGEGVTID